MGLLDSVIGMMNEEGGLVDKIKDLAQEKGIEMLAEKYPELAEKLQGMDTEKLNQALDYIKVNGIPKDAAAITNMIKQLTA